jgi:putative two-component system response regulator
LSKHENYKDEISSWDMGLFILSAHVHDVGKIAVPDHILVKDDKLSELEYEDVKGHVDFGIRVIQQVKENVRSGYLLHHAETLTGSHHEKWDGTGYPRGLKGEEIPLHGRLMAIADVYDALTSDRPYKKAFTHEEATDIINKDRGKHFDPNLVDIFLTVSDKFKEVTSLFDIEYAEVLEDT